VLVIITPKETTSFLLRCLRSPPPPPPPSSTSSAGAAAIALKFHPKHVIKKNKTKHIMKISHINVNIYDKTATSQQNSD
jgi:hypothetical protein